ncbi:MAG: bifunctional 2-C-methyl-D-erythritol 4-phosphate cytidylyltransferase/2-C-methyl-D-erythritol 2,4-cyclodiphosphate synthase [Pseudomonadota bacterium]
MPVSEHIAVLIVAAGRGYRAGGGMPKQYRRLGGTSVLHRTIQRFTQNDLSPTIQCVIHPDDQNLYHSAVDGLSGLREPVYGGATRQESVLNGLRALRDLAPDCVLIHDAARPFVSTDVIRSVVDAIGSGNGALAAAPVVDTLKRAGDTGHVADTVSRDGLWAAQTPQGFPFRTILNAHERALDQSVSVTDDAAIAEWAGIPVELVESGRDNIKLTTEADFADAESRLMTLPAYEFRTGHGYDVHAFEPGDGVILGGVTIPYDRKLKGHSDADVALHTITDALYGALGDGDIGHHFPPSDPQWKGAPSDLFLNHAGGRVRERNGRITNIDLTIICEAPKIGPHRDRIRARIAAILDLDLDRVSVKATTTERLGFTGRSEGIAASATATVMLPMTTGSDGA